MVFPSRLLWWLLQHQAFPLVHHSSIALVASHLSISSNNLIPSAVGPSLLLLLQPQLLLWYSKCLVCQSRVGLSLSRRPSNMPVMAHSMSNLQCKLHASMPSSNNSQLRLLQDWYKLVLCISKQHSTSNFATTHIVELWRTTINNAAYILSANDETVVREVFNAEAGFPAGAKLLSNHFVQANNMTNTLAGVASQLGRSTCARQQQCRQ